MNQQNAIGLSFPGISRVLALPPLRVFLGFEI